MKNNTNRRELFLIWLGLLLMITIVPYHYVIDESAVSGLESDLSNIEEKIVMVGAMNLPSKDGLIRIVKLVGGKMDGEVVVKINEKNKFISLVKTLEYYKYNIKSLSWKNGKGVVALSFL